jgi:hypothetical protein
MAVRTAVEISESCLDECYGMVDELDGVCLSDRFGKVDVDGSTLLV